jgi:hypothetical protein
MLNSLLKINVPKDSMYAFARSIADVKAAVVQRPQRQTRVFSMEQIHSLVH